jgi:AhpD family alkylhydroperoxidase
MTPETAAAFKQLHHASLTANTLDTKTKELIAVACGVTRLCEGCIVHHTKAAKIAGATLQELHETLDVCTLMNGGPATIFGKKAIDAYGA